MRVIGKESGCVTWDEVLGKNGGKSLVAWKEKGRGFRKERAES